MAHTTQLVEVVAGEVLPLSIDVSNVLTAGDTVSTITAKVYEETTLAEVPSVVLGTPSVSVDQRLLITIDARVLTITNRYLVKALLTVAPNAKVLGVIVPVSVVD